MLFDFRTAVLSGLLDGGFVRLVCRLGRRNQTQSASNSCHDYLKHPSLPLLASVSAHSFTTQYDSDATWPVCRLREEPPQRSLRGAQSLRRRLEVLCRALHFSLVLLRRNSESGKLLLLRVFPPGSITLCPAAATPAAWRCLPRSAAHVPKTPSAIRDNRRRRNCVFRLEAVSQ